MELLGTVHTLQHIVYNTWQHDLTGKISQKEEGGSVSNLVLGPLPSISFLFLFLVFLSHTL
jgi:hypothetical protein